MSLSVGNWKKNSDLIVRLSRKIICSWDLVEMREQKKSLILSSLLVQTLIVIVQHKLFLRVTHFLTIIWSFVDWRDTYCRERIVNSFSEYLIKALTSSLSSVALTIETGNIRSPGVKNTVSHDSLSFWIPATTSHTIVSKFHQKFIRQMQRS